MSTAGDPPHQNSPLKGSQNSRNLRNVTFILSAFTAPKQETKHTRDTLAGWCGLEITFELEEKARLD